MDAQHKSLLLQHGPVGLWQTSAGTADMLGVDEVRFNPDGSGLITTRSMMHGSEKVPFHWTMAEPGRMRLRRPPSEGDDEPDYWNSISIEFRHQRTDVGEADVLGEVGQDGFWWLIRPLRWVGPLPDTLSGIGATAPET